MNIKISDKFLREYIVTQASVDEIAKYLSLSGPNVESIQKRGGDFIYDIEVTTNRVDLMSAVGIARELSAILPRFGIEAKLKSIDFSDQPKIKKGVKFEIEADPKLINRVTGVVIGNIKNFKTPDWMKERLLASDIRSLGAPIDITNYIMLEMGQPLHVFDYDLIKTQKFKIRESKKGERVVTLDGKEYKLAGGDVVIDDTTGRIIDLPGIIGVKNSVVTSNTKRVILFTENNNPIKIRKTSMNLGIRTLAAVINEKGVDPTLTIKAILRGILLFKNICKASPLSLIIDKNFISYKQKSVKVKHSYITESLGVNLTKKEIKSFLTPLGFDGKWNKDILELKVPSFRANDISRREDIVEEVARIYGFHNLPSKLISGGILSKRQNDDYLFFENKLKRLISCLGGNEVYTSSLIGVQGAYKLKNPLGTDSTYLRTTLLYGLVEAALQNHSQEKFHIFELSNVYLPNGNDLPLEKPMLSGVFFGYDYRRAKGVIETFLEKLHIEALFNQVDKSPFLPGRCLLIRNGDERIGMMGYIDEKIIYYEFDPIILKQKHREYPKYKKPSKYPAQVEDITLTLPERTKAGDILSEIKKSSKFIENVRLDVIYNDNYTFRVWYLDPRKTMTDKEVKEIRNNFLMIVQKKFGVKVKN